MTLQQETRGDITIFKPSGRVDSASSAGLEQAVLDRLQAGGKRLVFDLSGVDYISSAGLRVILLAGKKLQPVQGALVLCGLRDEVRASARPHDLTARDPLVGIAEKAGQTVPELLPRCAVVVGIPRHDLIG